MDERVIDSIFIGSLKELPPLQSKIVRIFTSSTFTDMSLERNTLMESVYPKIKEYCKEKYGLEFQVVDMRWGVRDEATDDHMTTEICMKEIENCQRLSKGPNFVAFLGQKYGYRPIPTIIEGKEFKLLKNALEELESSEMNLVDLWYKKDKNSIPSVFLLQPISSILINFTNRSDLELQTRDQNIWWQTLSKLQTLLRMAANHLFDRRIITPNVKHNYMMSVTEREITNGILNVLNAKQKCLAYFREINSIDFLNTKVVDKFIDITPNGDIDREAHTLLNDLRDNRLMLVLKASNWARFNVEWSENQGLNSLDHSVYLQSFCEHFYNNITKLVRKSMRREDQSPFGCLVNEILHHLHSCVSNVKVFEGREIQLKAIEEYIKSDSNLPLVIHGCDGCGKTCLLAKASTLLEVWTEKDLEFILCLRFIGTTPDSSSVISLLTSICQQISYNFALPFDILPDDLIGLTFYFKQLLLKTKEQLVFIFIDSIDQLSENMESTIKLSFLVQKLPKNVKIVISCSSATNHSKDFETLNKIIENRNQFIEVSALGPKLAIKVMKLWLSSEKRDITLSQWEIVEEAIRQCSLPIFLKLVFAEIIRWKSYWKVNQTILSNTVMDSIFRLLDRIEVQHGKTLVSHALSYITASKSGLSESELEDLLSLDDIVLNDVFQYHLPPARRIPPLLWTRIRNDLPNYLTERDANGVNAMNWYHKQFRDASIQRYFTDDLNFMNFHSLISDYYLGVWGGGQQKPFKYTDSQKERFKIIEEEGMADRKVPVQPLAYFNEEGKLIRYNLRKLAVLPFHLIRAKRFDDLLTKVLFDYNFLHSKLSCFALQTILSDFDDSINYLSTHYFSPNVVKEITLLSDTLKLSAPVITKYPNMLCPQILGRLLPLRHSFPNINNLLKQCDSKGGQHCALLPVNHCLHTPGGPLIYSLEGHLFAIFDFAITSDNRYIISVSNKFILWDLFTGEISLDIDPLIRGIMLIVVLTTDDRFAISYTNYNEIIVLNTISSEYKIIGSSQTKLKNNIIGMSLASDRIHLIAWTTNEWIVFNTKIIDRISEKDFIEYSVHKNLDNSLDTKMSLVMIEYLNERERHMIYEIKENQFLLQTVLNNRALKMIEFVAAFALNTSRTIVFVGDHKHQVLYHRKRRSKWSPNKLLNENEPQSQDLLLSLKVYKSKFLVAFHLRGFRIWTIDSLPLSQKSIYLNLPTDCCNIRFGALVCANPIVFSKSNLYAIAANRKCFYIWSMQSSVLLKSLEAHFTRIIQLKSWIVDGFDAIVSSSFDKTIRVWNVKNVFEPIHTINRMDLSIDSISFCTSKNLALTLTRNSIGIWVLETGQLITILSDTKFGAIVSYAFITNDSKYIISIESDYFLIRDFQNNDIIFKDQQICVHFMNLVDNDSKIIIVKHLEDDIDHKKMLLIVREIPSANILYELPLTMNSRSEKMVVITRDNQIVVIPTLDSQNKEILSVFRLRDGVLIHNIKLEKIKFNELIRLNYESKETVVGLIGSEVSYIIDVFTQRILAKIKRWNGTVTSDGRYGLFGPTRGGLELIDLYSTTIIRVLLPQTCEGVINFITGFTSDDKYVYYYHSIQKNIRLISLENGNILANYRVSADVKTIKSSPDSKYLVIGGIDGSLTILLIADPNKDDYFSTLSQLPNRLSNREQKTHKSLKMSAKLATIVAKEQQKKSDSHSKLCSIS